jgi:hypothetical protein
MAFEAALLEEGFEYGEEAAEPEAAPGRFLLEGNLGIFSAESNRFKCTTQQEKRLYLAFSKAV